MLPLHPNVERYFLPADIHEAARERAPGLMPSLVAAVLFTLLHTLNLYLLFTGSIAIAVFVLFHLVLCAITAAIARILSSRSQDGRFAILLAMASFIAGAFGALGGILCMLLVIWHSRFSQNFNDWFQSIFPSVRPSRPQHIYENLMTGRDEAAKDYDIVPFLDVMSYGSEAQKREALSRMAGSFDPRFAPVFHKALVDPSNSIRVQAATSLTRIENLFLDRLMKLTQLRAERPDDAAVILALAMHLDDYAFTGILDTDREQENRMQAYRLYASYIAQRPGDVSARLRLGRLLLREGKYEEAADWFAKCETDRVSDDSLTVWYLEALYNAGRFNELREKARSIGRHPNLETLSPGLSDSISLWAGTSPAWSAAQ